MTERSRSQPVGVANLKVPNPVETETLANVMRGRFKNCRSRFVLGVTWQRSLEWPDGRQKKASKLFRTRSSYAGIISSLGGFNAAGKQRIVEFAWQVC